MKHPNYPNLGNEDQVWMIQRRAANGLWWTITSMVRRTRSEAIGAFKEFYVDGDKQWRKQRDAGSVRCVWGLLYSRHTDHWNAAYEAAKKGGGA